MKCLLCRMNENMSHVGGRKHRQKIINFSTMSKKARSNEIKQAMGELGLMEADNRAARQHQWGDNNQDFLVAWREFMATDRQY